MLFILGFAWTKYIHPSYFRIQGDINGWMNLTDPLDDTKVYNQTGLVSIHRSSGIFHSFMYLCE